MGSPEPRPPLGPLPQLPARRRRSPLSQFPYPSASPPPRVPGPSRHSVPLTHLRPPHSLRRAQYGGRGRRRDGGRQRTILLRGAGCAPPRLPAATPSFPAATPPPRPRPPEQAPKQFGHFEVRLEPPSPPPSPPALTNLPRLHPPVNGNSAAGRETREKPHAFESQKKKKNFFSTLGLYYWE